MYHARRFALTVHQVVFLGIFQSFLQLTNYDKMNDFNEFGSSLVIHLQ